jgi:hypothetical protein
VAELDRSGGLLPAEPEYVQALADVRLVDDASYQYEDHAPVTSEQNRVPGGTGFGGGSLHATVVAFAGSVKSTTQGPAW